MKGLILCAGKGTRMQPFSFSVPKTLLPVANQPVLDYGIQKLVKAGIREIGVVLNPGQPGIVEHLEKYTDLDIYLIYQQQPLGIADAVQAAQPFIGNDSFVLLLGDNLIQEPLGSIVDKFTGHECAIMLSRVENPWDFGIATLHKNTVLQLQEKPKNPPSNLAVIGVYVFHPVIFEAIANIEPSMRGEYEITDAIQWMIDHGHSVSYAISSKQFSDVGTIDRWLQANRWVLEEQLGESICIGPNTIVENCTLHGPVMIGSNCVIRDAEIGPDVSIQDGSVLESCHLSNSICMEQTNLRNIPVHIVDSVFGRACTFTMCEPQSDLRIILSDKSHVAPNS